MLVLFRHEEASSEVACENIWREKYVDGIHGRFISTGNTVEGTVVFLRGKGRHRERHIILI